MLADRTDRLQALSVMGLPVHCGVNYADWLIRQHRQGNGAHVITLNAEMAMQADQNPALKQLIRQADLVVPDGAGVVLYLRVKGQRIQRSPGIEVAENLLKRLMPNESVFFYGGAPGVAIQAARYWQRHLPGLTIAGTQHGYLSPDDQPQFLNQLKTLQPDVIFVGMGVPRQELWIAEHRSFCPAAIWVGVGGSFDIWAGTKTRAPEWLRNNHLEWLYRLYQEPWRWRRMLALPQFAWRSLTYGE